MGGRHCQVRETGGFLGEFWSLTAPFKRQDLVPTPEHTSPQVFLHPCCLCPGSWHGELRQCH